MATRVEELYRLNRVGAVAGAVARLTLVIEGFRLDDNDLWPPDSVTLRFRADQWDAIAQARNEVERQRKNNKNEEYPDAERAVLAAIGSINLGRCWRSSDQRAHVPVQQWSAILEAVNLWKSSPVAAVALGTEEVLRKEGVR